MYLISVLISKEYLDKGTKATLEYRVFGHVLGGKGEWPGAVNMVLGQQVNNFKRLL
ncbi:MAG: hypothetical protein ACI8WB_003984 [Phenylobacterium sp.]|jgi:hypothetical protein